MEKMKRSRHKFSSEFNSKVPIETLIERENLAVLGEQFELHLNHISQWEQEFLENSSQIFEGKNSSKDTEEIDSNKLYSKISKLEMDNYFLTKLGKL